MWIAGPNHAPLSAQATQGRAYSQPFTDTIRYVVDLGPGPTEIRLDPLPGKGMASIRIRLVPDASGNVTASVTHLPVHPQEKGGHVTA
jgi:hypothetical protein